jgi:hypothetical protein
MALHQKNKMDAKRTTAFATRTHESYKPTHTGLRDLASGESSKKALGNDPYLPMLSPFWAWRFTAK